MSISQLTPQDLVALARDVPTRALPVYLVMLAKADADLVCSVTADEVAKYLHVSPKSIYRATADLRDSGWLREIRKTDRGTLFQVMPPRTESDSEQSPDDRSPKSSKSASALHNISCRDTSVRADTSVRVLGQQSPDRSVRAVTSGCADPPHDTYRAPPKEIQKSPPLPPATVSTSAAVGEGGGGGGKSHHEGRRAHDLDASYALLSCIRSKSIRRARAEEHAPSVIAEALRELKADSTVRNLGAVLAAALDDADRVAKWAEKAERRTSVATTPPPKAEDIPVDTTGSAQDQKYIDEADDDALRAAVDHALGQWPERLQRAINAKAPSSTATPLGLRWYAAHPRLYGHVVAFLSNSTRVQEAAS